MDPHAHHRNNICIKFCVKFCPTGRTVQVKLPDNDDISEFLTLAVQAAFDWVYFADPNYVRLSVIPSSKCEMGEGQREGTGHREGTGQEKGVKSRREKGGGGEKKGG